MEAESNQFDEPDTLHDRAFDNIHFIRSAMERAGSFTAVPGWGMAANGVTALGAAYLASRQPTQSEWLLVWMVEAAVAMAIAAGAMFQKARASGTALLSGPGRKFLLTFVPSIAAAAVLTPLLYSAGQTELLPALWLLLYGAAVVTGGAVSIRIVPSMGLCFMVLGVAASFVSLETGNMLMATGFGLVHIVFGLLIARRYGG